MSLTELSLNIPTDHVANVFGQFDAYIKKIERTLNVTVVLRGESMKLLGEEHNLKKAEQVFLQLIELSKRGNIITEQNVNYALALSEEEKESAIVEIDKDCICHTINGKPVKPKTLGQKAYVDKIREDMIVFGVGPAGTGKTYLAMAMAITAFRNDEVGRIILTRPAIEAGEKLGFLPGDLQSKVDPYLRPLYDALYQIMGPESFAKNMEKGLIEVAPLAYMRGRTLEDAFVILDEAQNTTIMQMKMFLTRLGFNSKMIVNGDMSQIDLPRRVKSGLVDAMEKLKGIKAIDFVHFSASDVVRHPVVADIINAYEKDAPKFNLEEKSEGSDQAEEVASGLTEYPVIGAEDVKK